MRLQSGSAPSWIWCVSSPAQHPSTGTLEPSGSDMTAPIFAGCWSGDTSIYRKQILWDRKSFTEITLKHTLTLMRGSSLGWKPRELLSLWLQLSDSPETCWTEHTASVSWRMRERRLNVHRRIVRKLIASAVNDCKAPANNLFCLDFDASRGQSWTFKLSVSLVLCVLSIF